MASASGAASDKPSQSLLTLGWKPSGERGAVPAMGHRAVTKPVSQEALQRACSSRDLPGADEQEPHTVSTLPRRGSFRILRKVSKEASAKLARIQPPTLLDSNEYVVLCHMLCGRLQDEKLDAIHIQTLERFARQALLDLDYMRNQAVKALKCLKKIDAQYRVIAENKLQGQQDAYEWLEESFKGCLEVLEQGRYRKINYSIVKKMGDDPRPFELRVVTSDKRIALIESWQKLLRFMEEWRITMPSIAEMVDKKFAHLQLKMPDLQAYEQKTATSNQEKLKRLISDIGLLQNNWAVIADLVSKKAMPAFWPADPGDQHSFCLPHETKPLPSCHDLKSFLPRGDDAQAAREESAWLPVPPAVEEDCVEVLSFVTESKAQKKIESLQKSEKQFWNEKLKIDIQKPAARMRVINPRPDQYFSFQPVAVNAYSSNCTGALKELSTLSKKVESLRFATMDGTDMTSGHVNDLSAHIQTLKDNRKRWERHIPSLQEIMDQVYYSHPILRSGKAIINIVRDPKKTLSTASRKLTDYLRDQKVQCDASVLSIPVLQRHDSATRITPKSYSMPRHSTSCPELPLTEETFIPSLSVITPSPASSSIGSTSPSRGYSPEPSPCLTGKETESQTQTP